MSEEKNAPSQSTTNSTGAISWTSTQAYCAGGILPAAGRGPGISCSADRRRSARRRPHPRRPPSREAALQQKQPDPNAQAALAQAAAPLLEAVNKDPNDFDSLVKLGNLYYDGQQFPSAIQYYERALAIHPDNPDVRTDMGTAYWYTGNSEKALAAMETSLKYRPGHPQTLFNLGWVRWQGKQDPKGAIEAWQQLLKANPDYPERQQVEQYIAKAKEHARAAKSF